MLHIRSFTTRLLAGTIILAGLSAPALAATPADTLVIANTIDDLKVLDPAESFEFSGGDAINNIYRKLVELDPKTLKPTPGVAASWSVGGDGRVFTFKIAPNQRFASGNPVTADDVVFSLRRVVKLDKTPSFIISQFGLTKDNADQTIRKVDDTTVEIQTDKPYAPTFLYNALTADVASIVDMKTVMENESGGDMGNEWLKTHSAGSGPYVLRAWKPNESVLLEANPNWPEATAMKRVFVRHVPEPATQRLLLERGDVDIARNLTPEDVAAVQGNAALKVVDEPRGRIYYLSGNQKYEPLAKPGVMQAIKSLVDYDGMASSFLKGQVVQQQNFLPVGFLGAVDDHPFKLDVAKAKEMLSAAGYPDGFDVEILVRNDQQRLAIAQSLQNTLGQAGIRVSIKAATGSEVLSVYRARNAQLTLEAWGPDYPDPNTNASVFASNENNSDEGNLVGNLAWRNAYAATETTPLVAQSVVEQDEAKRVELYHRMQQISRDSSPFVMLFQQIAQNAMGKGVEGFTGGGAVSSAFYYQVTKAAQ
ncbi:ABC transporter substrate-binding protein [Aureimonas jatrophae]|uniref:Peptide/nickel transport system substrate-binding protein n=1 Tax=Aureimonas jatrophae TaxID=1166073 RepID=A0A1H0EQJ7_9HYPH|nr:ABC transporter substrate-binding protein [Aureimonas jatrophae]MBB3950370.1 peptide/nickel transport system substrate-binding protein [Aureimonas jatrophae]SDN84579.1 peptide/nickel transport system substrate-binding protein [Aureimonas jatrophae]